MSDKSIEVQKLVDQGILARQAHQKRLTEEAERTALLRKTQAELVTKVKRGFQDLATLLLEAEVAPDREILVKEPRQHPIPRPWWGGRQTYRTKDTVVNQFPAWDLRVDMTESGSLHYGDFLHDGTYREVGGLCLELDGSVVEWVAEGAQSQEAVFRAELEDEAIIPFFQLSSGAVSGSQLVDAWGEQIATWGAERLG